MISDFWFLISLNSLRKSPEWNTVRAYWYELIVCGWTAQLGLWWLIYDEHTHTHTCWSAVIGYPDVISAGTPPYNHLGPLYSDVTWVSWRLKSPAHQPFVQQFVPTTNKASKLRISGSLWKESTGDWWDSPYKGPVMWKAIPCHGVVMCAPYYP